VIKTRQAILSEPGKAIEILIDDATVQENIARLAATLGYDISSSEAEGAIKLALTPNESQGGHSQADRHNGSTVVYINSDQMGTGDPELGQLLLKNFIFTLLDGNNLPEAIYLVNNGVKLSVAGSDVLEPLRELANQGVDIASCGLCLEFFGLKNSLAIGRISNMLELVNAMAEADLIVRP
jgi:selenium metabolism protein YedF